MTRRHFIKRACTGLSAAMLTGSATGCRAFGTDGRDPSGGGLAYVPLNGRSLTEIVERKQHHGRGRYLNPFSDGRRGFGRVLYWKLFSPNRFRKYYDQERETPLKMDFRPLEGDRSLSVTWLKHATLLIKDAGEYLLVDPVFSNMFFGIRDFTPLAFDVAEIPRPDHLLITHGHYDHLSVDSLAALGGRPHVIRPPGYGAVLRSAGITGGRELDWFQTFSEKGREITLLPCNHWTMRNPLEGPNTALWGSYLIRTRSGATILVAGDSAYFDGFEQLGQMYDIDLAIFNLGAYEPRWFMAQSHMNPAETVRAFLELGAKEMMVVHWGTYRLGDEPVHFPAEEIRREMAACGLSDRLIEIRHGQTLRYGRSPGNRAAYALF